MALKTKTDYFGLASAGWEVTDTSENRSVGYTAEAQGPDGFLVAIDVGGNNVAPQVDYIATANATLAGVVLSLTTLNKLIIGLLYANTLIVNVCVVLLFLESVTTIVPLTLPLLDIGLDVLKLDVVYILSSKVIA